MKFLLLHIIFVSLFVQGLAAAADFCGRKNSTLIPGIALDSCFEPAEVNLLRGDGAHLNQMQFDPAAKLKHQNLFSARSGAAVLSYLDQRVALIVPFRVDPRQRMAGGLVGRPSTMMSAFNLGFVAWVKAVVNGQTVPHFATADGYFSIRAPKVGIIQTGKVFTKVESISRLQTLVHEARHSDCADPRIADDLRQLAGQGLDPVEHLYSRSQCGHAHSFCPQGHPLAGLPACDDNYGGSNSFAGSFSSLVVATCANCREPEKQLASMQAVEAWSRVLSAAN